MKMLAVVALAVLAAPLILLFAAFSPLLSTNLDAGVKL
jgi:hypothetical protein